jgi:hypothetical protein
LNRSGALKLTAIFVVLVLGISTVGFGLQLASNSNNATVAATNQGNHDGSSTNDDKTVKSLSNTITSLSSEKIVLGSSVTDKAIVSGLCSGKTPKGTVDFQVSSDSGSNWVTYDSGVLLSNGVATSKSYTPIAAGNYEFRAVYSGDCNYYGSPSLPCTERLSVVKATTTASTIIGAAAIIKGQSVTDNVTVTGLGVGFPVPTGTVDFQVSFNNGTWTVFDAGVVLVNGQATSALYTPAEAGYYSFQAIYSGDSNYRHSESQDGSEILMVAEVTIGNPGPSASSTETDLGTTEIVLGSSVRDNATVTGVEGANLHGTVDFLVSYNGGTFQVYDNEILVNGIAQSAWYTPAAAGNYRFVAYYSGNHNVLASSSEEEMEPLLVTPASTHTHTCLSQSSIKIGSSVFDTAYVSGLEDFVAPTGTVTFSVSSDNGKTWTQIGAAVELVNGKAVSAVYAPDAAGTYEFQATYSGDSNYLSSSSCPHSEILTVRGEVSCITLGQSVTDNATVAGLGGDFPVPTGTVDFQYSYMGGAWTTFTDDVTLVNANATSGWFTPLATGHYNFRAVYSGDSNYVRSVSGNTEEPLNVKAAPSTTSTLLSSSTITLGGYVTDAATVTGLGGIFPVPTGTVTFQYSFNGAAWTTYDAHVALVDGSATSTIAMPLAAGNYEFRAIYSGDSNYLCSVSGAHDEPLLVHPTFGNVITDLGVKEIVLSQSVTDNVTIVGLGGPFPVPTGTVTFQYSFNGAAWTTYDANVALVNGNATSAFNAPLLAGNYEFRAIYSGDSNYLPSVSAKGSEPLLVTPTGTDTTTKLSSDSIVLGHSVFDKAFVAGLPGLYPVPTGTVNFQVSSNGGDSWMTYDYAVTLVNGVATSTCYVPTHAGTYWFRAVYSGDVNYLASQSCAYSEKLSVERANSYTYTCMGTDQIVLGQSVTDNVTVIGVGEGFPIPTGPVSFQVSFNGGEWVEYSNGMLDSHGKAVSGVYTPLAAGHYEFRVVYSCDSNYLESTSGLNSEPLTVEKAPSTTTTDLLP